MGVLSVCGEFTTHGEKCTILRIGHHHSYACGHITKTSPKSFVDSLLATQYLSVSTNETVEILSILLRVGTMGFLEGYYYDEEELPW